MNEKIKLTCEVRNAVSLSMFHYYIAPGQDFDVENYCDACGLDQWELKPWGSIALAAKLLKPGQWLYVTHDNDQTDTQQESRE